MKLRSLIKSISSILLCCCYLAAIVGFDVHTDHHDGEVFVVSLLEGIDCESIHPGDVCHCFEHDHGTCHEDDEDCENEVDVISITGTDGDFHFNFAQTPGLISVVETPCLESAAESSSIVAPAAKAPPRQTLSLFCVLRV